MKLFIIDGESKDKVKATLDHPEGWFVINLEEIEFIEGDGSFEGMLLHYKSGHVLRLQCESRQGRASLIHEMVRVLR